MWPATLWAPGIMERVLVERCLPVGALATVLSMIGSASSAQDVPSWVEIGPFFGERCTLCHSGPDAPLGLRLDSYEGAMIGSQNGPVLIPGDPDGSELIRRVRGMSQPQMPLVGDLLTEEEIGRLEAWILAGLPEGTEAAAASEAPGTQEAVADEEAIAEETPAAQAAGEEVATLDAGPAPEGAAVSQEAQEAEPEEPLAEAGSAAEPGPARAPEPDNLITFADVERIFLQRCVLCHSDAREGGPPEGLRLDTYEHILEGGERLVLIPGNAKASEIVRRIEGTAEPRMPLDGPPWLDPEQIALIRRWIEEGARDVEGTPAPMPVGREVRFRGVLTGPQEIDGIGFRLTPGTRIDDRPEVGEEAEVRGVVAEDAGIEASRLRDR